MMFDNKLASVLKRELPSCHVELDEVCVNFYPTLNPEYFGPEAQCPKNSNHFDHLAAARTCLDEHELALVS